MNKRFTEFYISFSIFLVTLQSLYFFGGAWITVVGLLMLIPLANGKLNAWGFGLFFLFSPIVLLSAIVTQTSPLTAIATVVSASALVVIPAVFHKRSRSVLVAIRFVVKIHLAAILLQVVFFFGAGEYIDFLQAIGLSEQRVISAKGFVFNGVRVPRFAGLFNEPGTYSTIMGAMLATLYSLERRWSIPFILGFGSLFLTASMGGIVVAIGLAIVVLISSQQRRLSLQLIAKSSVVICALGLALPFAQGMLDKRALVLAGRTDESMVLGWLIKDSPWTILGLQASRLPDFYTGGYFGAGLDIALYHGALGILVVIAALLRGGVLVFCFSMIVLLAKLKLTYPALYVFLAVIYISSRKKRFNDYGQENVVPPEVGKR